MVPRGGMAGNHPAGAGPGRWDGPDPACATTSDPERVSHSQAQAGPNLTPRGGESSWAGEQLVQVPKSMSDSWSPGSAVRGPGSVSILLLSGGGTPPSPAPTGQPTPTVSQIAHVVGGQGQGHPPHRPHRQADQVQDRVPRRPGLPQGPLPLPTELAPAASQVRKLPERLQGWCPPPLPPPHEGAVGSSCHLSLGAWPEMGERPGEGCTAEPSSTSQGRRLWWIQAWAPESKPDGGPFTQN